MLLKFIFENFLSFENETTLDLIATGNKEHDSHLIKTDKNVNLLSLAALYGANASGKSNLVKALDFARDLIVNGMKPDQSIPQNFFKLNKECYAKPSKFEFLIYADSKIYHYFFSFDKSRIHEEWLYVKNKKGFAKYFERLVDEAGKSKYEFGPSFVDKSSKKNYQFHEFIMKGTRKNQLFLTEAKEKNIEKINPLYGWFNNKLEVIHADSKYAFLPVRTREDKTFLNFLCEILKNMSNDIDNIKTSETPVNLNEQFPELDEEIRKKFFNVINDDSGIIMSDEGIQYCIKLDENRNPVLIKLKTKHKIKNSDDYIEFQFEDESDGTKRFIHLAPALVDMIYNDKVIFIDELDRRLHPLLSRAFVEIYLKSRNPNSQLVFTTHESNLLDAKLFRRDEIWFTEKDATGSSHITSLAEYKERKDLNYQKGYLNGRFGAIPFLSGIENIKQLLK
ncbi:ATP-binding protein [candidate division KSB1 bacterium]|nr:ATP-binding protein [candidate division KSB1 bacterium]